MYGLDHGDRFEIKRIAGKWRSRKRCGIAQVYLSGRIVPAIGTTTATVSGLVRILKGGSSHRPNDHWILDHSGTGEIMFESNEGASLDRLQKLLHQHCSTISHCQRTIGMHHAENRVGAATSTSIHRSTRFSPSRKFDVNIWSSFELHGNADMTLDVFIQEVEVKLIDPIFFLA